jgi:diadenosine tetraphosphate (Ap4A) HIT family hydrolase
MRTKDFLGREWQIDCFGCGVAAGAGAMEVPGGFLAQTSHFVVHQDPLVPLPGFLVVASRRHIRRIDEMTDAEYSEFARLLRDTQRAIKEVNRVPYLTLVQEENSEHFHAWFFPWSDELIAEHGRPSLDKIRPLWAHFRSKPFSVAEWSRLEPSLEAVRLALGRTLPREK